MDETWRSDRRLASMSQATSNQIKDDRTVSINGISGIQIPDSKLAREVTELIRDTESELLFSHSARVYC
jgi:hypothetical protein